MNSRPLAPEASALAKLSHSPLQTIIFKASGLQRGTPHHKPNIQTTFNCGDVTGHAPHISKYRNSISEIYSMRNNRSLHKSLPQNLRVCLGLLSAGALVLPLRGKTALGSAASLCQDISRGQPCPLLADTPRVKQAKSAAMSFN